MAQGSSTQQQSEHLSLNIKYDSFAEEASKFKINSMSKLGGGVGTVAESRKRKQGPFYDFSGQNGGGGGHAGPFDRMRNLDRMSTSERKALGVFASGGRSRGASDVGRSPHPGKLGDQGGQDDTMRYDDQY